MADAPATPAVETPAPSTPAADPNILSPSPGFNSMKEKLEKLMGEVIKPVQQKPMDTQPVDQPVLEKVPKPGEKPAEPAKAEPPKEDPVSPKAADWKKLKAERDDWQKKAERATALEKELVEVRQKAIESTIKPEDFEALKKDRQSLSDKLEQVALERSDRFHNHYNNLFTQATEAALEAAGKDKADQVKAVLEAPKSTWRKAILNEIIGQLDNDVDKLSLLAAVTKYDETRSDRDRELANYKVGLQKLREQQQSERETAQKQAEHNNVEMRRGVLSEVMKKAAAFEAFQEKEGDADHNAFVAKSRKLTEDFIMGRTEDGVAAMFPALASEGERLLKVVPKLNEKIAELEKALEAYKGAAPTSGEQPGTQKTDTKPKGFVETVMQNWPKPT